MFQCGTGRSSDCRGPGTVQVVALQVTTPRAPPSGLGPRFAHPTAQMRRNTNTSGSMTSSDVGGLGQDAAHQSYPQSVVPELATVARSASATQRPPHLQDRARRARLQNTSVSSLVITRPKPHVAGVRSSCPGSSRPPRGSFTCRYLFTRSRFHQPRNAAR